MAILVAGTYVNQLYTFDVLSLTTYVMYMDMDTMYISIQASKEGRFHC